MKNKKNKNWYSKVKNRLHFDVKTNKYKARSIVQEENVAHHAFFPFVHFEIKQFKLSKKLEQKELKGQVIDPYKRRDIYYSCHSDSYIFSYYNELILNKYIDFLDKENLDCSIAYRHIDKNKKQVGKSNIDFAAEAFKEIEKRGNCYALGLDITGFFDNLNHEILYKNMCKVLSCEILPSHWNKIYKNLTKFHYIDLDMLLINKYIKSNRRAFWNEEMHSFDKICSPEIFRQIIKENPEIIQKNQNSNKGIPQGTNISGTLANIYMIDFDNKIQKFVNSTAGYYRRYSDDILIVINSKEDLEKVIELINKALAALELELSNNKTICCKFDRNNCLPEACTLKNISDEKGFQYLGFTYDGKQILVRDGTISAFWRDAFRHIRKMVLSNYFSKKRIPIKKIYGLYSHLSNEKSEYGNFYHYIRKSQRIMEKDYGFGNKVYIAKQMSKSWEMMHKYLWKLKQKYKIPDSKLFIPDNLVKKFINEKTY